MLNIPIDKLEDAGESITSMDNVAEFREEPMFDAIRMEHDICIEVVEDERTLMNMCQPTKCEDGSEYFYRRMILREGLDVRPIARRSSSCIVSREYKFVFINVLRDSLSDIIHDALMAGCHSTFLESQNECDPTLLDDDQYFVFAFVRDPYARLVANWYTMMQNKVGSTENMIVDGQIVASDEEILHSLSMFTADPSNVEYASLDWNRMRAQSEFMLDGHQCPMVDFVGKWESAKEDFEWAMHHIQDRYAAFPKEECVAEMHSLENDPQEHSWRNLLINNSQIQQQILTTYAGDFKHWGYSKYV